MQGGRILIRHIRREIFSSNTIRSLQLSLTHLLAWRWQQVGNVYKLTTHSVLPLSVLLYVLSFYTVLVVHNNSMYKLILIEFREVPSIMAHRHTHTYMFNYLKFNEKSLLHALWWNYFWSKSLLHKCMHVYIHLYIGKTQRKT